MPGKYFDELEVGMTIQHSLGRTITESDNVFFNALTMNTQPLHLNEDFSRKTQFGKRIVNSLSTITSLTLKYLSCINGTLIPL